MAEAQVIDDLAAPPARHPELVERLELDLLCQAVYRHYGSDFREYATASLMRRVWLAMEQEGVATISQLQDRVLHDAAAMDRLVNHISVNVTSMFRDADFWKVLRDQVLPVLGSNPFIRIWHAGCATGEEVYSMAILLTELGLYDRCRIYATDMNDQALRSARDGIFPLSNMRDWSQAYLRAGGAGSLSDHYRANYDHAIFRQSLKKQVLFSQHNLVTDGSFNEFNLILCRNVMIYFNNDLQNRVHRLLYSSLRRFGVLALGRKESLLSTPHADGYTELSAVEKLYRKTA
jgi:chemotaxis protein methyltransferase CheR